MKRTYRGRGANPFDKGLFRNWLALVRGRRTVSKASSPPSSPTLSRPSAMQAGQLVEAIEVTVKK